MIGIQRIAVCVYPQRFMHPAMTYCLLVQKWCGRRDEGKSRQRPSGQTPDEQRSTEDARDQSFRTFHISNAILLARVLMVLSSLGLWCILLP